MINIQLAISNFKLASLNWHDQTGTKLSAKNYCHYIQSPHMIRQELEELRDATNLIEQVDALLDILWEVTFAFEYLAPVYELEVFEGMELEIDLPNIMAREDEFIENIHDFLTALEGAKVVEHTPRILGALHLLTAYTTAKLEELASNLGGNVIQDCMQSVTDSNFSKIVKLESEDSQRYILEKTQHSTKYEGTPLKYRPLKFKDQFVIITVEGGKICKPFEYFVEPNIAGILAKFSDSETKH